jgi:hypothetical protein
MSELWEKAKQLAKEAGVMVSDAGRVADKTAAVASEAVEATQVATAETVEAVKKGLA